MIIEKGRFLGIPCWTDSVGILDFRGDWIRYAFLGLGGVMCSNPPSASIAIFQLFRAQLFW